MRSGALIAGKYRLRRLLGEGAVGQVWSAVNERTEREVALKLIAGANREQRERALREARACGRVSHRNVVEIYDAGETEDGDPFLVMQLLSGETVAERLRRDKRVPPPRAAAIALEAARGLAAAHAAGIIHRDLKPSNIFLQREPETGGERVKLVDFGVSKMLLGEGPSTTRTGDLVGSPSYMSPEQARADDRLNHRTDLWSLGVVLFEMIAGERPFPSRNIGVIAEIMTRPIPPLSALVPDIDPRLSATVARCLERDADRRVQTADELVALLRPCAGDEGVDARSASQASAPPSSRQVTVPVAGQTYAVPEDLVTTVPRGPSPVSPPQPEPFRPVPRTIVDVSRAPRADGAANPAAPPWAEPPSAARAPSASYRPSLATEDDFDQAPTAQMHPDVSRAIAAAYRASAAPASGQPAPPAGGVVRAISQTGPQDAVPASQPGRFLRKGDGALLLVGASSIITLLLLAAVVFGISRLASSKDAPPASAGQGAPAPSADAAP